MVFNSLCFAQISSEITSWLKNQNASLVARISQYDHEKYNLLTNQTRFDLGTETVFQNSKWRVFSTAKKVNGKTGAVDFIITFQCLGGTLKSAAVSIDLDLSDWSKENYVLLPAAAYNGNRFEWRRIPYSPKLYFPPDIGKDKPIIVSDIPKLNESEGFSRIQERSGSMSTPSIGFSSVKTKKGLWMLTEQGNNLGDYGINIEENRQRDQATISITSPIVRELYNYRLTDSRFPSQDTPKDFKKGDQITIKFRLYSFDAPVIQSLFNKFAEIRKDLAGVSSLTDSLSYSASMTELETKFNRDNFVPKYGYYSVGLRENFLQDWQIGWTGGMISTYPMLFAGDEQTRKNVVRNFDWLFPDGISPSGFFYDSGKEGTIWYGGDIRKLQSRDWHLVRKSGDAVYYILKQLMLMEKLGIPVKSEWKNGTQKVCDSIVKLWKNNKQFGQFVDSNTGEIKVGGSTSGALIPAALVLASKYFNHQEYLQIAEESADYFNQNFVVKGLSVGGPGDALQNPDSESWYSLIESYVYLFEATGDKKWLEIAKNVGKQFSTWVVSYNFKFPEKSLFGKNKIHSVGAVYANTQNKHAAPGLCTFSGLAFLKLYRATGDKFYLELLQDIAHNIPQYLPHPKKPVGTAVFGRMSERVNLTDWEGIENIGEIFPMTTWAETSLMLTTIEIPGLYVEPDKSLFAAFDNIAVKVEKDDPQELVLRLTNNTPVEAKVKIWEEKSKDPALPLAENYLLTAPSISLNPTESKILTFRKEVKN